MKRHTLITGTITLLLLAAASLPAASQMTTYAARSGSKMRIEGSSNIHDWQVESPFIGGLMEVGPGFPMELGQAVAPGKVEAKADVFIQVRSLKSIEKDGSPYSDKMDEIMWEHLKEPQNRRILYRLSELTLKEAPKSKDAPYVFDAKGDLAVAGVTNNLAMEVTMLPLADNRLEINGTVTLKMTDFKVEPPAPKIALGLIKTGDEVKLIFKWILAQRKVAAATAP